jgi:hypothetical protein
MRFEKENKYILIGGAVDPLKGNRPHLLSVIIDPLSRSMFYKRWFCWDEQVYKQYGFYAFISVYNLRFFIKINYFVKRIK